MGIHFEAERDPDVLGVATAAADNYVTEGVLRVQAELHSDSGRTECLDCDEPIPAARLEAYPAAERCTPCQEDHDVKYRHR